MKRRQLLHWMGKGLALSALPTANLYATEPNYTGRLLLTVQADGGWDVTSVCDPKMNVPGEDEINVWARSAEIQTAGNIQYAPFASSEAFFQKYYRDILVINGIDSQTNAHAVGILHSWSGRNAAGYPSLPALMTAIDAPTMPMSYVSFGGFGATANLIRPLSCRVLSNRRWYRL